MYLEKVKIRNFRLFQNLEFTLSKGMNVVVGENDSGKTALVDAVRLTLGTNVSDRNYLSTTDFFKDTKEFLITLKFSELGSKAHVFLEHLTYEPINAGENKAVLYISLHATLLDKEKRGYPVIKSEFKTGIDGEGLLLDSELRSFLATTYLKPLRDAAEELSSGRGSRLAQILGSSKELKTPAAIDEILNLIATANTGLVAVNKPISITSDVIKEKYLHNLIFEADKPNIKAIIDIAGIKDIQGLTDSEKRKYLRSILESLSLSLSENRNTHGLGYENLLFMSAELLLLEQDFEIEAPLLLIEEPEAHLHPQLQMKLLDFLQSKVKTDENANGIQCILTTHSPNLASKVSPENVIIMSKGNAFSLRSSETELDANDYIFLQKFLDATKANLFFSRSVLLVEGDSENILIPVIAKLLERPLENYGASVINIGSTAWKRFAKIFLRKNKDMVNLAWLPIKVAILCDLDLWPNCAEETEENAYGFKTKKDRNRSYWKSSVTDLNAHKINMKDNLERQNIKVLISNEWTFEYSLAYCGLFQDCYDVLNGPPETPQGYEDAVPGSIEEKSTYILREVVKSKTDLAQKMALYLEKKYKGKSGELRTKLPSYIVEAIEYVTEALPVQPGIAPVQGTPNV